MKMEIYRNWDKGREMKRGILIHKKDNVVVVTDPVAAGDVICYQEDGMERHFTAREDIPIYHKGAICRIEEGEPIVKYGEKIGVASRTILEGQHVHTHNCEG